MAIANFNEDVLTSHYNLALLAKIKVTCLEIGIKEGGGPNPLYSFKDQSTKFLTNSIG